MTTKGLGPDPGITFQEDSGQTGGVWITELIRLTNRKIAAQDDSVATNVVDLRTDFNSLLAKLRAVGLMEE